MLWSTRRCLRIVGLSGVDSTNRWSKRHFLMNLSRNPSPSATESSSATTPTTQSPSPTKNASRATRPCARRLRRTLHLEAGFVASMARISNSDDAFSSEEDEERVQNNNEEEEEEEDEEIVAAACSSDSGDDERAWYGICRTKKMKKNLKSANVS